jgi:hypothetical protein
MMLGQIDHQPAPMGQENLRLEKVQKINDRKKVEGCDALYS